MKKDLNLGTILLATKFLPPYAHFMANMSNFMPNLAPRVATFILLALVPYMLVLSPVQAQQLYSVDSDLASHEIELYQPQSEAKDTKLAFVNRTRQTVVEQIQVVPKKVVNVVNMAANDVYSLIQTYASQYNADPSKMIAIAHCESGLRANAVNGPFAGAYQFLSSTWQSNRRAMGLDPDPTLRYNIEEAIKTAAFKMGRDGYGAWPVCQYANSPLASR